MQSASVKAIHGPRATLMPALRAAAGPEPLLTWTRTPASWASCAVASSESRSTTTIVSNWLAAMDCAARARRHAPSVASALRAGTTTEMTGPAVGSAVMLVGGAPGVAEAAPIRVVPARQIRRDLCVLRGHAAKASADAGQLCPQPALC